MPTDFPGAVDNFTNPTGTMRLSTGSGHADQHADANDALEAVEGFVLSSLPRQLTLSGNTSGALAAISSGTVTLAGGNNITLSQAGNAVTISGASQSVQAETQTFVGGVGNSETTYTSGTINLSVVGGAATIRSTTGQAFQLSVSQSTQPGVAHLVASDATFSSGTVSMTGVGGNITVNTAASKIQISHDSHVAQTNQSAIRALGASNTGNTAGNTGVSTGIDWVVAGTNNITISQSTAGGGPNTLWVSGAAGGAETQTAISGLGNSETTYTSGTVALSGLGGLVVRSTTGQAFQISQTVQTQNAWNLIASDLTVSSGTVSISGFGAATVNTAAGNIRISVPTGASATGNLGAIAISGNSTSAGAGYSTITSGTAILAGGPNITLSQNGATISISAGAGGAETQTAISGLGNSETTYTSGTVALSGLGGLVVRSTTGNAFQLSQTVQTQNAWNLVASDLTVSSGTVSISGFGGNLTVNTAANNIRISHDSHVAQTNQSAIRGLGVSNTGQTAGNTGISTGIDWVIAASTNITASQSTVGGGPNTIWLSGPNAGAVAFSVGFSTGGNTLGTTHMTATRVVFAGGDGITLSGSTEAAGGTVSIHGPNDTLAIWRNMQLGGALAPLSTLAIQAAPGTIGVYPLEPNFGIFPGRMTANTVFMPISLSGSTATMSQAYSSSISLGIYTNNAGTLSLLNSVSTSFGSAGAATNNSTLYAANRWLSIHSSQWSAQPVFTKGHYWFATAFRTAGVSCQSATVFVQRIAASNTTFAGTIGAASAANNTTRGWMPFYGIYTATSAALPASINSNQFNKQVDLAIAVPYLQLNAISASF